MKRLVYSVCVFFLLSGAALAQEDTATPTETPSETPTHTETATVTPTRTQTATVTHTVAKTPQPTPIRTRSTPTANPVATAEPTGRTNILNNSHVHALELTLYQGKTDVPLYQLECQAANGFPDVIDKCRCVIYFSRRSGTNGLYYSCEDGVEHAIPLAQR